MSNKSIHILILAIMISLAIIGCGNKKMNPEHPHAEQESTAPRNGLVLDEELDTNSDNVNGYQNTEKNNDPIAPVEPAATEEIEASEKHGIAAKVESGDLIQPADKDSAIEIP